MGSAIKEAKGTTDKLGAAVITIESTDPSMRPGVALGFYRVEITKAGENIPAKYNTATVLGQEIAPGDREVRERRTVRLTLLTGRVRAADVPDRNKTVGGHGPPFPTSLMAPLFGVLLHAIGGLAAGSFYAPFRKIANWSWETAGWS